jgi:hypothetical protein
MQSATLKVVAVLVAAYLAFIGYQSFLVFEHGRHVVASLAASAPQ